MAQCRFCKEKLANEGKVCIRCFANKAKACPECTVLVSRKVTNKQSGKVSFRSVRVVAHNYKRIKLGPKKISQLSPDLFVLGRHMPEPKPEPICPVCKNARYVFEDATVEAK